MNPETEKLLQTWLKIQIWQFKIYVFKWVFMLVLFVFGAVGFFGFVLPRVRVELIKLDRMQRQLSGFLKTTEKQGEFLDEFGQKDGQSLEFFDALFK